MNRDTNSPAHIAAPDFLRPRLTAEQMAEEIIRRLTNRNYLISAAAQIIVDVIMENTDARRS